MRKFRHAVIATALAALVALALAVLVPHQPSFED